MKPVIVPLLLSRRRPHLGTVSSLQLPVQARHLSGEGSSAKDCLGGQGLEHLPCELRLQNWGLFGLRKVGLGGGDLTAAPQYLWGGYGEDGTRLLVVLYGSRLRNNRQKLK